MNKVDEILKKIRKIDIRTRKLVNETFLGSYHSHFRGTGIEFSEVADYHYGDDIRTIDWNVTARVGSPYVKKFVESRELSLIVILDISASQEYGSSGLSKRELAAETAGVIAFSAIRNNDKVGLILTTDEVEFYLPPAKGFQHLYRLLREALFFEPKHKGTRQDSGLEFLSSVFNRRQISFLISDFQGYTPGKIWKNTMRRHELVPIIISDPRETDILGRGIVECEDLESGESHFFSLQTISGEWKKKRQADQKKLVREFRKIGQAFLDIEREETIVTKLQAFFEKRKCA
ncbi:MAG: DUF58 domain-containing protein [Candidatus Wallbacteria bacterium]|nr:DUF58 domain-containing protein [Candidatus Wallbacteria bacterium]